MGNESVHITEDVLMLLPKELSHGPTVGDRAAQFIFDDRCDCSQCPQNRLALVYHLFYKW